MIEVRQSDESDAEALLAIWCRAVDATHHFLRPEDRAAIEPLVADYVRGTPMLVALREGQPVAFIGTSGSHIDALFVDPQAHGQGIGRMFADRVGRPATVDVNEQNEGATAFYRRLGFAVTGRSELDEQGRPYPLLHLRRD